MAKESPQRPAPRRRQEHGDRQRRGRDIGGRGPVGIGLRNEALDRDQEDRRHGKRRQHQMALRAGAATRQPPQRHQESHHQHRAEDAELAAEKAQRTGQAEARVAPVGIGFGVADGGKAVRRVPRDVGREQHQPEGEDRQPAQAEHQPPRLGRDQRRDHCAKNEIEHRVFGQQTIADGDAADQRPAPAGFVHRPQKGVERHRPAEQQRHVGGDQAGGIGHPRQGRIGERTPESQPAVADTLADGEQHQRRRRVQQWRGHADRPFAIAEQPGGRGNDPGDQRRLGEIAEVGRLRPPPVLRLVGIKLQRRNDEHGDAQRRQRGDKIKAQAPPAPVVGVTHLIAPRPCAEPPARGRS